MIERQDIQFISAGLKCAGWHYWAAGKNIAPCVILAHGFGGVKEMRLEAYAERFVQAGYHALVFDYRHFGESEGEPRQLIDIKKQHQDWRSAIKFVKGLSHVDPHRIILWGTSFSGGHVLAIAGGSQDPDIAAVISQVPHLSGPATAATNGLVQALRLGLAACRDLVRQAFHRSPYYVPAIGHPGELAAMTAPGAADSVKKLYAEGFTPNELVAARVFLSVGLYSPGKLASKMNMPWLVQVAANDLTTPVYPAMKAALKAPKSQLMLYKCDHFDVYIEPFFEQIAGDQIMFLSRSLTRS
jgi:uncharacterized protein